MGNYLGYSRKDKRKSMSLGTNGSGNALFQLFAVGYAASKFPDSQRARRSVVTCPGAQQHNPEQDIPFSFTTQEEVQRLLALDGDDCFWASFSIKTAGSGFFLKHPKCNHYRGVLIPLILAATGDSVNIPAGESVTLVANAWEAVLPQLQNCCAVKKLTQMAKLAREAADNYASLEMS
jgi:hypothetical protein